MAEDYYSSALEIARALDLEGLAERADRIRSMVHDGSTSTEILMGIRWELEKLVQERATVSAHTGDKVMRLLELLNRELSS